MTTKCLKSHFDATECVEFEKFSNRHVGKQFGLKLREQLRNRRSQYFRYSLNTTTRQIQACEIQTLKNEAEKVVTALNRTSAGTDVRQ